MLEKEVLTRYKLTNKSLVFPILYKKADGLIYEYIISYLSDYSDVAILSGMHIISQQNDFIEWILP